MGLINAEVIIALTRSLPLGPWMFLHDSKLFPRCFEGPEVLGESTQGAVSNRLQLVGTIPRGLTLTYWA